MISPKASLLSVEENLAIHDVDTDDVADNLTGDTTTTTSDTSTGTVAMATSSQHKQEMDALHSQLVSAKEKIGTLEDELSVLRKEKEAYRSAVST